MTTEMVPTSTPTDSVVQTLWFRFVVRAVLVLLAMWMLSFAADRYDVFFTSFVRPFDIDSASWLVWLAAMIGAGLLFGLAAWLPFARVRFLPSRLLLVAVLLFPLGQFWWVLIQHHGDGWLGSSHWFEGTQIQFVLAAFAGVALASAFQAKRSSRRPE